MDAAGNPRPEGRMEADTVGGSGEVVIAIMARVR